MAKTVTPGLTDAQERFAQEYVKDFNATRAYMAAHPNCKEPSARVQGSRTLATPHVAARVRELQKDAAEPLQMTVERVVRELAALASANADDYYVWAEDGSVRLKASHELTREQKAAIQEISQLQTRNGKQLKVKLYDKHAALATLGRYFGMFIDKVDLTSQGEPLRIVLGNPWAKDAGEPEESPQS